MKHHASSEFWTLYNSLSAPIRKLADKNFALLKSDPHHPSLSFKRIGRFYSARVGISYRVLGVARTKTLFGSGSEAMLIMKSFSNDLIASSGYWVRAA